MSDLPLILRSLWSVVPSEATGAAANADLVVEHAFPSLSRGEESLFAFLLGFHKQHGAAPADTTVLRWVEDQHDPLLTKFCEDAALENPVYGPDFTTACVREVASERVTAFTVAAREVVEIGAGRSKQPLHEAIELTKLRMDALTGTATDRLPLVTFDTLPEEPLTWFWPGRIPAGMVSFLVGDPDQGKSAVTIDWAFRISTGTAFPDGTPCPRGKVIIMSAEDDLRKTIKPRLRVAGADQTRISTLPLEKSDFCLDTDLPRLEATLRADPEIRLIILDPLLVFIGGTDTHNEKEVRKILSGLWRVCALTGVTIIGILHFRKATGSAIDRVAGSRGFSAAPRSIWGCGPHPDDSDDPHRHIFLKIKGNLGRPVEGLTYRTVGIGPTPETEIVKIEWEAGAASFRPNDVFGGGTTSQQNPDNSPRAEIEAWLRDILKSGPLSAKAVGDMADGAGYRWKTVLRASVTIGVRKEKKGFQGAWEWSLPPCGPEILPTEEDKKKGMSSLDSSSSLTPSVDEPPKKTFDEPPQKVSSLDSSSSLSSLVGGGTAKKTDTPCHRVLSSLEGLDSMTVVKEDKEVKEVKDSERGMGGFFDEKSLQASTSLTTTVSKEPMRGSLTPTPAFPEDLGDLVDLN